MRSAKIPALFSAMRPKQWTKNALVMAGYIFAIGDKTQPIDKSMFWDALAATLLFCLLSSAVYLLNDVKDREQDRHHPEKKNRPVASGDLTVKVAMTWSFVLMVLSLAGGYFLSEPFVSVLVAYLALQIAYTLLLKRVSLVDIFVIATGFVLRALGGALVVGVEFSPWLLLCTLLLALFLALCKRRHEKVVLSDVEGDSRPALDGYDEKLLDQLIAIVSSATIVCYSLYTLWPDTIEKFNSDKMSFTIPFVLFGIFRYLDLVYRHRKGDKPEQILLTDGPLLVNILLYGVTVLIILL